MTEKDTMWQIAGDFNEQSQQCMLAAAGLIQALNKYWKDGDEYEKFKELADALIDTRVAIDQMEYLLGADQAARALDTGGHFTSIKITTEEVGKC